MKVTTHRWIQRNSSVPDVGTFKTDVTIRTESLIVGIILNGHLTRKQALTAAYNQLLRENRWSISFLRQLASIR